MHELAFSNREQKLCGIGLVKSNTLDALSIDLIHLLIAFVLFNSFFFLVKLVFITLKKSLKIIFNNLAKFNSNTPTPYEFNIRSLEYYHLRSVYLYFQIVLLVM